MIEWVNLGIRSFHASDTSCFHYIRHNIRLLLVVFDFGVYFFGISQERIRVESFLPVEHFSKSWNTGVWNSIFFYDT